MSPPIRPVCSPRGCSPTFPHRPSSARPSWRAPRVPRVFSFTRRGPDSAELRSEVHLRRHTKHERAPRGNGALLNLVYVYLVNRLGRRPGRPAKFKKPAGEIARQAFHGSSNSRLWTITFWRKQMRISPGQSGPAMGSRASTVVVL